MTDLVLLSMFVLFVATGFISPFVWSLGYIWVDTLLPQFLSYSLLRPIPVALIMAGGSFLSYMLLDRRSPPKMTTVHVLCAILGLWITLTCTWAVLPDQAWHKWDPSFKVMLFTVFIPFVFRSRVQIEAFLLTMLFAMAAHILPWGMKTALSGGGYQLSLGLLSSNTTMLAESSSIAAITVMCVPLLLWMRTHSLLIPWPRIRSLMALGMTVLYLIACVGTFARTGLLALAMLAGGMLLRTKRKVLFIMCALVVGGILVSVTSDRWTERMETVNDYQQESSAYTRILVWKWTLGFVAEHPLGGGFNAYMTNVLVMPPGPDGQSTVQFGRAYHNIFFAALGEHGFPGLVLYVSALGLSLLNMSRLIRKCRDRPDLQWAADLARASQLGLLILLACGNFVDISFLFLIWDMVALMMCLTNHVAQALKEQEATPQSAIGRPSRVSAGGPIGALSSIGRRPAPQYK